MATYKLIKAQTLGSVTASVSFTSIPSDYTDLLLKVSARSSKSATYDYLDITFNGSSSSYSDRTLYAVGSSVGSASQSASYINYNWITASTATTDTFGNLEIYLPNYISSNYKSVSVDFVGENNSSTGNILGFNAGLWSNTAAISSIGLAPDGGSFSIGSSFYLYGISNA